MLALVHTDRGAGLTSTFDLELLKKRLRRTSLVPRLDEAEPVAAVAIIVNPNDSGGSILLIKRTRRVGDPWSGQVAFPGGHKAGEDRDLLATAIREAREEVGIDLRRHELLGRLPVIYSRTRKVPVVPYVFQLKDGVVVQSNEEVAESFWVPLHALNTTNISRIEVSVEEGKLKVDAYIYQRNVIWGLTFRIINVLLNKDQRD
jgi:8-oxo-dGTP pyrophosphatase MutT (NUDIX family)